MCIYVYINIYISWQVCVYMYIYVDNPMPKHDLWAAGRTFSICSLCLHRRTQTLFISSCFTMFTQKKAPTAAIKKEKKWTNKHKIYIHMCSYICLYDCSYFLPMFTRKKLPAADIRKRKTWQVWSAIMFANSHQERDACGYYKKQQIAKVRLLVFIVWAAFHLACEPKSEDILGTCCV